MERVLYLEPDEEITSVIDRMKKLESAKIALVIPRDAVVLQSLVNLRLLEKEAKKLKKKIAIVTADKVGRNLASQAGLQVYEKLDREFLEPDEEIPEELPEEKSEEEPKKALEQKPIAPEPELEKAEATVKDTPPVKKLAPESPIQKKAESPFKTKPKFNINKKLLIFGLIFSVFVTAFLLFLFLPKAQIKLIVKAEKFSNSLDLKVDKNVVAANVQKKTIPGQLIETSLEKEDKASSTGTKEIGEKARGTVTIYNNYDSDPQVLNAGTRFTKDGKTFLLTSRTTVPGFTMEAGNPVPGTATAAIEAEKEGESYNISAGKFSIAGFPVAKFYAQSANAMSGGYSKTVTVISQKDLDTLKENILNNLKEDAKKELAKKIKDDLVLLDEAIELNVTEFTSSAKVDSQVSEFTAKVKVEAKALVYKKADFENVVFENFKTKVSSKQKELAKVDYNKMQKTIKNKDYTKGQMTLALTGDGYAGPKLDEAKLKANLIGKDRIRAEEYLRSFAQIESAEVNLWPFWVKKVPSFERKVKIDLEYQATQTTETKNK